MTDDELRLFAHEAVESSEGDNSPVEHEHMPTAEVRSRPPTVVFSCETEQEIKQLVARLEIDVKPTAGGLVGWWPEPPDHGALRFDV